MYPTCLYLLWCPPQGLTPGRCSPSKSGLEDFFSNFLFCASEKIRFQGHRILLPTDTLNWPSWPWHPVSGIPAQWGLAPTSLCYSVLPDAAHCPLVRESVSLSPPLADGHLSYCLGWSWALPRGQVPFGKPQWMVSFLGLNTPTTRCCWLLCLLMTPLGE